MANSEATKVIFRRWKTKPQEIIALFPQIPGTSDPYTCESYMHNGQHGAADPQGVMQATVPASEEEYASLKRELEHYGPPEAHYVLKVAKRVTQFDLAVRRAELQAMRKRLT